MPLSRSISRIWSRISWLISPLPFVDQVAAHDRVVRDLDCLFARAELERALTGGDELAAEAGTAVDRRARAQCHLASDGGAEVRGLAQRALEPRRGDLDREPVEVAAQDVRDALAERVVDAARVVDVDRHPLRPRQLDREHLDA